MGHQCISSLLFLPFINSVLIFSKLYVTVLVYALVSLFVFQVYKLCTEENKYALG